MARGHKVDTASALATWLDARIKARYSGGVQWNVPDLSRASGVPEHTVRRWITQGMIPEARWLRRIALALEVSVDELLALIEAEAEAADVRRALAAAEAARRVRPKGRRRG